MDIVGGVILTDGSETKTVTCVDDHSRFAVAAAVVRWATGRAGRLGRRRVTDLPGAEEVLARSPRGRGRPDNVGTASLGRHIVLAAEVRVC